jgi:hypothetical protein
MGPGVFILITDGKGKGRLQIDGRLDLLCRFLSAIQNGDEKNCLNITTRPSLTKSTSQNLKDKAAGEVQNGQPG